MLNSFLLMLSAKCSMLNAMVSLSLSLPLAFQVITGAQMMLIYILSHSPPLYSHVSVEIFEFKLIHNEVSPRCNAFPCFYIHH